MSRFLPTTILRHRKENLKKCSLRGLEERGDLHFLTYPIDDIPFLSDGLLLDLEAPPLTAADHGKQLFLIDGTWNYAAVMHRQIPHPEKWTRRSLPAEIRTAYPRKQTGCSDPDRGLAQWSRCTRYSPLNQGPSSISLGARWVTTIPFRTSSS